MRVYKCAACGQPARVHPVLGVQRQCEHRDAEVIVGVVPVPVKDPEEPAPHDG